MSRPGERLVTLHDGRQVSNYSEEWRHECEARHVLNMPTKTARQNYLWGTRDHWGKYSGGIRQKRGDDACRRLEDTILALWQKQAANDNEK